MNIEIGKLMKIKGSSKHFYFAIIDEIDENNRVLTKQYLCHDPFHDRFYFISKPRKCEKMIYLVNKGSILNIQNPSIQEEKLYTYCRKHPNLWEHEIMNIYEKYQQLTTI